MLTSRQHPLAKLARALRCPKGRRENGLFLVEGANSLAAALQSATPPTDILATPGDAPLWEEKARGTKARIHAASPELLAYAADSGSVPSAIGIAPLIAPASELPRSGLILILDGIGDPGNAGTLLRAADAIGASQVAATAGSVDLLSPKAARSSAGSLWSVPLSPLHAKSPGEMLQVLEGAGIPIVSAQAHGGEDAFSAEWPPLCALVIGHETRGVSEELSRGSRGVTLPMWGRAESLNAAMAGTLLLYSWRQAQPR